MIENTKTVSEINSRFENAGFTDPSRFLKTAEGGL